MSFVDILVIDIWTLVVDTDIRKRPIFFLTSLVWRWREKSFVFLCLVVKTALPLFSFLHENIFYIIYIVYYISVALILRFKGLLSRSLLRYIICFKWHYTTTLIALFCKRFLSHFYFTVSVFVHVSISIWCNLGLQFKLFLFLFGHRNTIIIV